MPLRKKHVQRLVLAILLILVLGPLLVLGAWGFWIRGGGMERRLEAVLESRLRCRATVTGLRPTGLQTAKAEKVELVWTAEAGRLALRLEDVGAESNRFGWYVRAAHGAMTLAGPRPRAALAALNQRLAQVENEPRLMSVVIEALESSLDLGGVSVAAQSRAVALSDSEGRWQVSFRLADAGGRELVSESELPGPAAVLVLDGRSDGGVFGGLTADFKGVPAGRIAACFPGLRSAGETTAGSFDVSVRWHWPEADPASPEQSPASPGQAPAAARVHLVGTGLELADWTAGAPGGPITGKAEFAVDYVRTGGASAQVAFTLESADGGQVSAETLRWLADVVPTVRGYGDLFDGRMGYEALHVAFDMAADGSGHLAEGDEPRAIFATNLFGEEVPMLWSGTGRFGARDVWAAIRPVFYGAATPGN